MLNRNFQPQFVERSGRIDAQMLNSSVTAKRYNEAILQEPYYQLVSINITFVLYPIKFMRLLLLFLICPFYLNAQQLKRNEIDRFTKHYIKETSEVNLYKGFSRAVSLSAKSIDSSKVFAVGFSDLKIFRIPLDGKLYILFDNDSSLELKSIDGGVIATTLMSYGSTTIWNAVGHYAIDSSQISLLQNHGAKAIRLYIDDHYLEYEIKQKNQWKFRDCLNLIL